MKPAAEKFAEALEQTAIELPTVPVIQNVNAGIATDVAQLRQALTAQLYQSVQWTRTMQSLQDQGIQYIVECGPGTVLSNLAKRLPNIEKAFSIDSKSKMEDALNAVLVAEGKLHDTRTQSCISNGRESGHWRCNCPATYSRRLFCRRYCDF